MTERKAGLPKVIIGGAAIIVGFSGATVGLWGIGHSLDEKEILVKNYPSLFEVNSAQDQISATLQELLSQATQAHEDALKPSVLQRETLTRAQEVVARDERKRQIMQSVPYKIADQKYIVGVFSMLLGFLSGIEGLSLLGKNRNLITEVTKDNPV